MDCALFYWGLLCVLISPAVAICAPTDYTVKVEKAECDYCVVINTTTCKGFCLSWDNNKNDRAVQRACVYDKVEYRTAILPGCPPHVNPLFTYPVAVSCHCSACNTDSYECIHKSLENSTVCSKPRRHPYAYPGQSHYTSLG